MNNNINFSATFFDRQLDRILFDRIHESISHCDANHQAWTYYPTVSECNKVLKVCVQRLQELEVGHPDLEERLEKEHLARGLMECFVEIQANLLRGQRN